MAATSAVHQFTAALDRGASGESAVGGLLRQHGCGVEKVGRGEQRLGIDRVVTAPGGSFTLEVKSDTQGHRTGNAFVETVSVDRRGKPGWVWTCTADYLLYVTVGDGKGWMVEPEAMRKRMWDWTRQHRLLAVTNSDYHTLGLLVPLSELSEIAVGGCLLHDGRLFGRLKALAQPGA